MTAADTASPGGQRTLHEADCPDCGAVIPMSYAPVDPGSGRIRCPRCDRTFSPGSRSQRRVNEKTPSAARRTGTRAKGVPEKIGNYEVIEEVARGGMGIVYRGWQPILNRDVAIKVLHSARGGMQEDMQRFRREAEAAARLQHSNIVPIHAVGQDGEQYYFVMDFIHGQTLDALIDEDQLTPRDALDIVEQCADALHYAHSKGVVHRDLKPANIILDHYGRPQITDFGLAKRLDDAHHLTETGMTVGTPAYMPPEQAEGDVDSIDAQSDVYSLGAVLYEMLTGQPAFEGSSTMNVLMKVLETEPIAPRRLNRRLHRDIETICLKAMAKEKHRRYATAADFADDIRRYKAGEVIQAAPTSTLYRLRRAMMRNVGATAVVFLALALTLGTIGWLWHQHWTEQRRARAEREAQLESLLDDGRRLLAQAEQAAASGAFDDAEEHLRQALHVFENAQTMAPRHPLADAGVDKTRARMDRLEADAHIRLGRKYLSQQNYEAAADMFERVLERYAPDDAAARRGLREALGVVTLRVRTSPPGASVALQHINDDNQSDRTRRLGRSPVQDEDVQAGRYLLVVRHDGYGMSEVPLVVRRGQEEVVRHVRLVPVTALAGGRTDNVVFIPAGLVRDENGRVVRLPAFYIDRYEYPNRFGAVPETGMTWLQAKAACHAMGKDLCTPLQYQRAGGGDAQLPFPYGEEYDPQACWTGPGLSGPQPSGSRMGCVSPFGVYDLSGNVAEWCNDDGAAAALGGSWRQDTPETLRTDSRLPFSPARGWSEVGFRCSFDAE